MLIRQEILQPLLSSTLTSIQKRAIFQHYSLLMYTHLQNSHFTIFFNHTLWENQNFCSDFKSDIFGIFQLKMVFGHSVAS